MAQRLMKSFTLFTLVAAVVAGSSCQSPTNSSKSGDGNTTANNNKRATNSPTPATGPGQRASDEVSFFGQGQVWLKVQGSNTFAERLQGLFKSGDTLKVGDNSSATVLCPDRLCHLLTGEFDTCCGPACELVAVMMRRGVGDNPPLVSKTDLPAGELRTFSESESRIRSLGLGEVSTQFLITNLYSNWKLKEANQQLDLLSTELAKPEAKQELKEGYAPITKRTADLHYKMAQTYQKNGDPDQAVKSYQIARDIYLKQGEGKSAAETEKRIVETKSINRPDRTILPKVAVSPPK